MEDDGPTASIIFIILVLIQLFLYGFSIAIDQLNEKEVERKAEAEKDKNARRLMRILDSPRECKNMLQLLLLLVHFWAGYLFISESLYTVLYLYIFMVLGILVPKKLARISPEKWAYAGAAVINLVNILLFPFVWVITKSAYLVLWLLGVRADPSETDVTEEEIIDMVNEGHEQGILEAAEAEMISNIFEYREKEAQDIMTNRNNIIALDGDMLLMDAIDEVLNGKQSRYPVYQENIDHIIGILHLKDAMRYHADHEKLHTPLKEIGDLLREPEFIPQTKNIDELFKHMQSRKLQMVIVIDEYGQTTGLVAMEDILEEIVGNILDEYDEETEYIEVKGNDEYIIEGMTPLEELEERFDISFGEVEFETLNGFMISKMDKIPEEDEQFEVQVEGYHFKVLSVENKMIHSVLVTRKNIETKVEEN